MDLLIKALNDLQKSIAELSNSGMSSSDVLAVVSIIIALMAFVFGLKSQSKQLQHNELSVEPLLNFALTHHDSDREEELQLAALELKNIGIGPAIIQRIALIIDGKHEIRQDAFTWESVLSKLGFEPSYSIGYLDVGEGIGAGDSVMLLDRVVGETFDQQVALYRVGFEVDYISSYEDRRSSKTVKCSFAEIGGRENEAIIHRSFEDDDFSAYAD